jgi:hypothetical protein
VAGQGQTANCLRTPCVLAAKGNVPKAALVFLIPNNRKAQAQDYADRGFFAALINVPLAHCFVKLWGRQQKSGEVPELLFI